ncbi:MAG TPA: helix-turn-helix transcriptional regulator [Polyangiaceae bacterium]|nr:helix-turn-helix transcriptional regulator [Polyangiaceae bacterium]
MAAFIDTSSVVAHGKSAVPYSSGSLQSPQPEPVFSELMRWQAEEADSRNGLESDLTGLWQELLAGRLTVADSFNSPQRWFMLLKETAVPRAVPKRLHALLGQALLSESQKRTASECGVAESTVSACVHHALTLMGVRAARAKVPPIVTLLAYASTGAPSPPSRLSSVVHQGVAYRVVSVERPELRVSSKLSASQYHVIGRIVEGWTYAQIAQERRRSSRTIANQVAGAFRRLGVSGRAQLVSLLVGSPSRQQRDC